MTQTILASNSRAESQAPRSGDPASQAPRTAGERALDCLLAAGFERTEPPILHPAAIFLDMSGEEVRRRLFLTADAAGEELCLRPEYTIPVCRAYLSFGQGRQNRRIFLSRPGFPRSRRPSRRADADRARELRPPGRRGGRRGGVLARHGGGDRRGWRRARGAARRRRPVRRHAGFAENSGAMAKAPAPRRRPRAEPRSHFQPPEPERARPTRGAGGAGERRSRRRQGAGRGSAGDRRHRRGRRAQRWRNRRPLSGTGVAAGRGRRSRRRSGRCWTPSWRFPAIPTRRRSSFGAWPIPPAST